MNVCTKCKTKFNSSKCARCKSSNYIKSDSYISSSDLILYTIISDMSDHSSNNNSNSSYDYGSSSSTSYDSGSSSYDSGSW